MLSDDSSSDSETGRFKCTSKDNNDKAHTSSRKEGTSKFDRRNRHSDDRNYRDLNRRTDERDKFDQRSRERSRHSRYSPVRRRSPDRNRYRRSTERHRYSRTSREKSKPRDHRSSSKDKNRSRSYKSPIRSRNIKDEIKGIITGCEKSTEKSDIKIETKKSSSPDIPKMSVVHKPDRVEKQKQKSESPILIDEHESDTLEVVQPGSYYSMIPAVVKEKSEESSEIDSSDDEKLRAKLLNLEKQLQKTKKKKHKKKHKKKSSKVDKEKNDSVEVSSTTDIHEVKIENPVSPSETAEVTSTQKSNQKESSEEGEISSDESQSQLEIDPDDLRHKLKRSKVNADENTPKLDVCGPALPPHLEKRFKKSPSPSSKSPQAYTPPARSNHNIGPSIPDDLRKVLAENSSEVKYISSEDEGIGPLPVGSEDKWSEAHQRLEERAIEMKIKTLDGSSINSTNIKSREEWMLELPEGKAKYVGLEARTFRAKAGPDMSDRSSWTDTPEEKARKAAGIAKEEDASAVLQREARERHIANRDEEQEKAVKKHKKKHKREESLLEMHQKKLKKKKKKEDKDDEKKERRPFSRDVDLQVNRFDEAQKKSIIKKAQGLNSRFSSGEAKYL